MVRLKATTSNDDVFFLKVKLTRRTSISKKVFTTQSNGAKIIIRSILEVATAAYRDECNFHEEASVVIRALPSFFFSLFLQTRRPRASLHGDVEGLSHWQSESNYELRISRGARARGKRGNFSSSYRCHCWRAAPLLRSRQGGILCDACTREIMFSEIENLWLLLVANSRLLCRSNPWLSWNYNLELFFLIRELVFDISSELTYNYSFLKKY